MKKKFLTHANLLLGAVSLTLAGCHTQKNAASPAAQPEQDQPVQVARDSAVICMYGVPVVDPRLDKPQIKPDTLPADTGKLEEPPRIMLKYGVPPIAR